MVTADINNSQYCITNSSNNQNSSQIQNNSQNYHVTIISPIPQKSKLNLQEITDNGSGSSPKYEQKNTIYSS